MGTILNAGGTRTRTESRLARRLTTFDAVVIGLGAMVGAGIFVVVGPAVEAAGSAALVGLLVAAVVAYCNALSSAQLAALYPESGGAYVYGSERLGALWGFLAGWGFVVGKLASCAAMALTFADYTLPKAERPLAAAAVLVLVAANYFGIRKTAALTHVIVAVVLVSLVLVVVATLFGAEPDVARLLPRNAWGGLYGVLQAAGLWFFAFAGYARLATLGEEVVDPGRVIPRAIPLALGITLLLYVAVSISAMTVLDSTTLAQSVAPLAAAVDSGRLAVLGPVVRIGAAVASLGVLLSLLAGVSRTVFAMASRCDLPRYFAAVHPRHRVPHRAELGVGVLVVTVVAFADVRSAVGFSAFTVLAYYAVSNVAALRLTRPERRWPLSIPAAGLVGCVMLACSLPPSSRAIGGGVLLLGASWFALRRRFGPRAGV